MKYSVFFILIMLILIIPTFYSAEAVNATLSCQVTSNCNDTSIFKMSSLSNAHAESWNLSNYQYSVCCKGNVFAVGNSCGSGVSVIKLSSNTNAHVERADYNPSTYTQNACISSLNGVSCTYTTQNCNSIGYDTCMATISADTNAHVADCVTDPYPTKICCKSLTTTSETNCTDGLDNDGDGLIDCQDPDCAGSIKGNVKNTNAQPILSANITLLKQLIKVKSTTTDINGNYKLNGTNCGAYDLAASHPDYIPKTELVNLAPNQELIKDFTLEYSDSCESDCTFTTDNIVHAACDGKNGCVFCDNNSKAACDNSQPGWIRDYNLSYYVICASGCPQSNVETKADVNCKSGTLVKTTRIVLYNGKPVKLVVATCG